MEYRTLGDSGLTASVLGMGCSRLASVTTPHAPGEVMATLDEAIEKSVTFLDTADVYGQGDSERLIGAAMRGRRDKLIVCTKAGLRLSAPQQLIRLVKPVANPILRRWRRSRTAAVQARLRSQRQCFEADYIRQRIEGSLRRLGSDYVDIFLLHNPPPAVLRDDRLFETLDRLKASDSVRFYGASVNTPEEAFAALDRPGVSCLQIEVNLFTAPTMAPVLERAKRAGVGIIAREPLAGGRAVGHPLLVSLAARRADGATAPGLALRFVADRDDVDVVLAGMTCRRNLRSNLAALDLPPLSAEEVRALSGAADQGAAAQ